MITKISLDGSIIVTDEIAPQNIEPPSIDGYRIAVQRHIDATARARYFAGRSRQ